MPEVTTKSVSTIKKTVSRLPIERGDRYVLVDSVKGCFGMYRITVNLKATSATYFEQFSDSKWEEFLKLGAIKATPRILRGDLELLSIAAEYLKVEEQAEVLEPEICLLTLPSSTLVLEYTWSAKKWQYQGYKRLDQFSAIINDTK